MSYRVEVTEPAEQDADFIYDYIRERSQQGAAAWWQAFRDALKSLADDTAVRALAPEADAFEEPLL